MLVNENVNKNRLFQIILPSAFFSLILLSCISKPPYFDSDQLTQEPFIIRSSCSVSEQGENSCSLPINKDSNQRLEDDVERAAIGELRSPYQASKPKT